MELIQTPKGQLQWQKLQLKFVKKQADEDALKKSTLYYGRRYQYAYDNVGASLFLHDRSSIKVHVYEQFANYVDGSNVFKTEGLKDMDLQFYTDDFIKRVLATSQTRDVGDVILTKY